MSRDLFHTDYDRERRRGPDLWFRMLRWLAVCGWLLMVTALVLVGYAKPEVETFFDRYYNIWLRRHWDLELARYIFYCMILGLGLSVAGIVINLRRHRRRHDEYRVSLFILALLSLAGVIIYLVSSGH